MTTYYDEYIVGYDDDDNPIYDTKLSHSAIVRRAQNATGLKKIMSVDWYDEYQDWDTLDRGGNPKVRVRAKVVLQ